jgi:peptidoglycan/LPS O-acetylase OafA/YrhL
MRFHLGWVMPGTLLGVQRFGWAGVDLFFVLSGFLIGSQLFKAHAAGEPILWPFYRRRMFRILPAYLVVLALYFAWPAWREFGPLAPLWQYLTFTENLLYDASWNHSFSHVWSLCIEEQFYLVLPLMLLALSRRPSFRRTSLILASFVVAGIVVRTWVLIHQLQPLGPDAAGADYMEHIYYPTYSRMDGLLAGVALALVKAFRPAWWKNLARRGHSTLLAGVALTALALWLFRDRWESETGSAAWGTCVGFPLLSLGLALVVASAVSQNGWLRLKIPGAALLASLAYSLYLTHKAAAHLAHTFLPQWTPGPTPVTFLVVAASCLGVAALRCRTPLHGPPRSRSVPAL